MNLFVYLKRNIFIVFIDWFVITLARSILKVNMHLKKDNGFEFDDLIIALTTFCWMCGRAETYVGYTTTNRRLSLGAAQYNLPSELSERNGTALFATFRITVATVFASAARLAALCRYDGYIAFVHLNQLRIFMKKKKSTPKANQIILRSLIFGFRSVC